jgi:hypothetical protein
VLVASARDSVAKETMHSILRDEVRHGRLAHSHALGARDVVAPHLPAMMAATLGTDLFQSGPQDPEGAVLTGYGALSRAESVRVTRECFEEVIFPGLRRFGIDPALGERWLAERTEYRDMMLRGGRSPG